jgi:hypothetical protein
LQAQSRSKASQNEPGFGGNSGARIFLHDCDI